MAKEASVRVRLDTAAAQKDIQKLGKEGQASAGRINEKLNRETSGLGGGFALGAGIAAGLGVVRGMAAGPVGDVGSEITARFGALLDETLGGADARAKKGLREEAKQIFAIQAGATGDTTAAKEWAARVLPFRQQVARGAVAIEKDLAPDMSDLLEMGGQFVDRIINAIKEEGSKFRSDMGENTGR
jgi:hypothetical protein